MRVRALQPCIVLGVHRGGPTFEEDEKGNILSEALGAEFDVPDDYEINPDVLEVVRPPEESEIRYVKGMKPASPPPKAKPKAKADGSKQPQ